MDICRYLDNVIHFFRELSITIIYKYLHLSTKNVYLKYVPRNSTEFLEINV